jgi:hypothetical protein
VSQVGSQPKAAAYLRATETSNADILLGQAGQPLATRIARARPDHWLKNLGRRQARTLFWRNMARVAEAIGIVHRHGLVHAVSTPAPR